MSADQQIYRQLRNVSEAASLAKIIAAGFEQLQDRYPIYNDIAAWTQLSETGLLV